MLFAFAPFTPIPYLLTKNIGVFCPIAISGTWACYNKGTTTNPVSQGNLATNIGEQTISISNLKEMDQYD